MFNRKGQSTLEYALIIAVVVGGLLLMQHYVKRGYSGRLKSAADEMGEQFDPNTYSANFTVEQHSRAEQKVENGVTSTTYVNADDYYSNRISVPETTETVGGWQEDEDLFKK